MRSDVLFGSIGALREAVSVIAALLVICVLVIEIHLFLRRRADSHRELR